MVWKGENEQRNVEVADEMKSAWAGLTSMSVSRWVPGWAENHTVAFRQLGEGEGAGVAVGVVVNVEKELFGSRRRSRSQLSQGCQAA